MQLPAVHRAVLAAGAAMSERFVRFTPHAEVTPDDMKGRYGVRNTATGEAVLVDIPADVILEVTEALNLAYAEGCGGAG